MKKLQSYFDRAIEIAEYGRGKTSPNPFVGALIVKGSQIIGEGYTQPWGSDHAEVQALKKAGSNAKDAEMIVTLEPCCSYGKTPPCTDAIIKAGIKKVYVGITDPNPKVAGKGIETLRKAGIKVELGFREAVIKKQLEYYLTWITRKRPFLFMKSAMTLDGYIAAEDGTSKWITGEEARKRVHELRQETEAIIIGIGTVLADDPQYNCRLENAHKQPVRIIIDNSLKIPLESKIVRSSHDQRTVIFCRNNELKKSKLLIEAGVEIIELKQDESVPEKIIGFLAEENMYCAMLESGRSINSLFINKGLIDKYYFFVAPSLLGNGIKVISLKDSININDKKLLRFEDIERIGDDILVTAYPAG